MRRKSLFGALAIIALGILAIALLATAPGTSADGDEDKNKEMAQGQDQALPLPEKTELKYPNLGSHLDGLVVQVEEGEATSQDAASDSPVHSGESVAVTIYLSGNVDDVVQFLEDNGGDPRNVGEDYIEAYVPVTLLGRLSEQPGVIGVREIVPPQPSQLAQQVIGNGPAVHGSLAWNNAGYSGQGVKVGIIDDFRGFSALGGIEVPATVVARCYTGIAEFSSNLADCERVPAVSPQWTQWPECLGPATRRARRGAEHGTWVAESLLDIAPNASLYIANPGSRADLQATVDWMASQGVTVINYSVVWTFDGPGDGTSPLSVSPLNTVDRAVDRGITWVNSAGNGAEDTWFGSYSDPDGDGFISFGGAAGNYEVNRLPLRACRSYRVQMRWEDRWGGANTDLDLYLYDTITRRFHPTIKSEDPQSGGSGHQPFEWISFYSRADSNDLGIVVDHHAGPVPEWVQVVSWSVDPLEHHTLTGSINNPSESDNAGMLAVGAAPWFDVNTIEPFSSQGPTPDGRFKPDIVGADCGATALLPLEFSSRLGGDCGFAGTSQAAPHVAGLAALVRQRFPDYDPSDVAGYLKDHADRRGTVPNNTWGHGFAVLPPIVLCSNNPGLEADCARLLSARDTLTGTGTLNWSASVPIEDWDGVTVGGSPLRVTELRLPEKGLAGAIPAELGGLANLEELWLFENQLTGSIPTELGGLTNLQELYLYENELTGTITTELGNLTNLTHLYLGGNELTGEIPPQFASLTKLQRLSLSDNQLTGTIPAWLGSLAMLENLHASRNQLTGTIPSQLGGLTNLEQLSLWDNELTGEIPSQLGGLTNLERLYLHENQLTGEIPTELGSLTNLTHLYLWENQLTGSIPTELGSLTNLTHLYLSSNQLTGTIPTQLGSLTNLQRLSLSNNQLTGPVPAWLGSLTNLEILSLRSNQLSGSIPTELGSLTNLQELYLYENELTGTIPTELGNLTNLTHLYLGGNELTGAIPSQLGDLANLRSLSLRDNQLTGGIPASLGNLTGLTVLSLRQNQLTGEIPSELGSLANLVSLRLSDNQLTGEIPSELGSLAKLERLTLENNQLTGEIPVELGRLENLTVLHLAGNRLTGCVPAGLRDVEDNDFAQLGLTFCATRDPLVARYDTNGNGKIEKNEVIKAINDYLFNGALTKAEMIKLINLYLFGPPAAQQSEAFEEPDGSGPRADADQPVVESSPQRRGSGHHRLSD